MTTATRTAGTFGGMAPAVLRTGDQWTFTLDDSDSFIPIVGATFYMIGTQGPHVDRLDFETKPGRTNQGNQPRTWGWLGTTDGIHREAMGRWRVVGSSAQRGIFTAELLAD